MSFVDDGGLALPEEKENFENVSENLLAPAL
jgi:hypothetical protein